MKRVVEEPPVTTDAAAPPRRVGISFVGNALFVLLILIAAVAGAAMRAGRSSIPPTFRRSPNWSTTGPARSPSSTTIRTGSIGQFSLQRRVIDSYNDFPKVLRDALISTEDKEFEKHWGVDVWRVFGAAWRDVVLESRAQGASTLTMQLARNLFLSPDRNFRRKMQEVMLSIQIERRFTKPQIFTPLRQPDLSRPRRLRLRGRRELLLQQEGQRPDAGGSCGPRRSAQSAELLFAHQQS